MKGMLIGKKPAAWLAAMALGLALLFACPLTASAAIEGLQGSGTESDPYQIGTAEDLCLLAETANQGYSSKDEYYVLTKDIDMKGVSWAGIAAGNSARFEGTFDGKGHVISGLSGEHGLFGQNLGKVTDLTLEGPQVKTSSTLAVGLIADYNGAYGYTGASISKVTVSGGTLEVNSNGTDLVGVGAVAGRSFGSITDCRNSADITINGVQINVGGIAGKSEACIEHCFNYGQITCTEVGENVGGIVGQAIKEESTSVEDLVKNSGNEGELSTMGGYTGGICGYLWADGVSNHAKNITNCYNKKKISAKGRNDSTVGGIAGGIADWCTVSNCYNAGEIEAGEGGKRGSIAGRATGGFIRNCYKVEDTTDASLSGEGGTVGGECGSKAEYYVKAAWQVKDLLNTTRKGYDRWYYVGDVYDFPDFAPVVDLTFYAAGPAYGKKGQERGTHGKLIDENGTEQEKINTVFKTGKGVSEMAPKVTEDEGWAFTGWLYQNGDEVPEYIEAQAGQLFSAYARWCQHDAAHLKKVEAKAPTCEEAGYEAHWECPNCGWKFADENGKTKVDEPAKIEALGHDYDYKGAMWTWDGYDSAEVTFTCKRDKTHSTSVTCKDIHKEVREATCTKQGLATYTAAVDFEGKGPFLSHKTQLLPKAEHTWGDMEFTWANDYSSVIGKRFCSVAGCGHVDVEITEDITFDVTKAPTCTEPGELTYVAEFKNPAYGTQKKKAEVAPNGHRWSDWETVEEATVEKDGKRSRTCKLCGEVEEQIISHEGHEHQPLQKVDALAATCVQNGQEEFWKCELCGKYFADEKGMVPIDKIDEYGIIPATGHDYEASWTWSSDNKTAVLNLICKNDSSHRMTLDAEIVKGGEEPTCQKAGKNYYTATVKYDDHTTYTDVRTEELPALGHNFGKWQPFSGTHHEKICKNDPSHSQMQQHTWERTEDPDGKTYMMCTVCGDKKPIKNDIHGAKLVLDKTTFTYNGKDQRPQSVTIDGQTLEEGKDYSVSWPAKSVNAGKYTVTVTGIGDTGGKATAEYTIGKTGGTLQVKAKAPKLKAKKLKKKKQTIALKKAMVVSKANGKLTYTKLKVNKKKFAKKFTINKKTGKITVKKGVKKGTYKLTVKVTAAGDVNHKPASKNVVIKIKVK